jgi:hypothetical protein
MTVKVIGRLLLSKSYTNARMRFKLKLKRKALVALARTIAASRNTVAASKAT